MTIDFDKPVQTRDGKAVTILTTERADNTYPVVGLINDKHICLFTEEGWVYDDGREHDLDLMNVPVKHTRKIWLNVYPAKHDVAAHGERGAADACAGPDRIACIPVTIEFEEGEGL